jgi:predicted transcriptional regulator
MASKSGDVPLSKGFREELDLLSRHIKMIQFVQAHGPIGIIRLSALLAVPKHKVRYSLRILEKEGFINPTTAGATATDKVNELFESLQAILGEVQDEIQGLLETIKSGDVPE